MVNSITNYFKKDVQKSEQQKQSQAPRKVALPKPAVNWWKPANMSATTATRKVSNARTAIKRPYEWDNNVPDKRHVPVKAKPSRSFQVRGVQSKSDPTISKDLSPQQKHIVDVVLAGKSVFYTGAAGTGKSFLLQNLIKILRQKYTGQYDVAVTATTGMASSNIGGETIHSWASWRIGQDEAHKISEQIKKNKQYPSFQKWVQCKVLVFDEISMFDGKLLEKLEKVARLVRGNQKPFGGIQLVFTGDFFQLPPVDKSEKSIMCFESAVWQQLVGENQLVLDKIFRQQNDVKLVKMLNEMRTGEISPGTIEAFKKLDRAVQYTDGLEPTQLYPLRRQVDMANAQRLKELTGHMVRFAARDTEMQPMDSLKRKFDDLMAPPLLELRVGAQVLHLMNKRDKQLVNGSRGRVVAFMTMDALQTLETIIKECGPGSEDQILTFYNFLVENKTISQDLADQMDFLQKHQQNALLEAALSGDEGFNEKLPYVDFGPRLGRHLIERESFVVSGPPPRRAELGHRSQLPLILSYALSIHKAQGQTIDRLVVDLSNVFTEGQAYVAVSRATTYEQLQVKGFDLKKVLVNKKVVNFYNRLTRV